VLGKAVDGGGLDVALAEAADEVLGEAAGEVLAEVLDAVLGEAVDEVLGEVLGARAGVGSLLSAFCAAATHSVSFCLQQSGLPPRQLCLLLLHLLLHQI
jgi:hypothetical protein